MTQISKEEVEKIALLGRLRLSPEEIELYQQELTSVLSYFEDVDRLQSNLERNFRADTKGLATSEAADCSHAPLPPELLLREAPKVQGTSFLVPRILD